MAAQTTTADDIGKLAYEGNFAIFRIKIEQNNSVASKKDTTGRAPLHWAASGGHLDIVEFLLRLQVPVNERDETQWTPLIIASSAGQTQIVNCLLSQNAEVNAVNQTGQSSLHYAASKARMEIAETLIQNPNCELPSVSECRS